MYSTPDTVITPVAGQARARTCGLNSQIAGRAITPRKAVNTISTAVSLCRKYLSTRNLSMWVENAYNNHMLFRAVVLRLRNQHIRDRRARRGALVDHQGYRQMHWRAAGRRAG